VTWRLRDPVSRQADSAPDATAVVVHESGESLTYAELDRAVGETAGRLAALGIGAGDQVGVLMDTRLAFVRLVHATARLGATLVPLNVRLTTAELDAQLDRLDARLLVCERDTERTALDIAGETPVASVDASPEAAAVTDERLGALSGVEPDPVTPVARGLQDHACILSTSGTGGRPKPVVLTVGNLLANAAGSAFRLGVDPADRWFDPLPTYHMGGLAPVVRSATYGTTVVVQREFEAAATADALAERDATAVSLVPTMLRRMLDERGDLTDSLRFVLLGGAPAPDALVERCADRGVPVCPTYGMTEAASQIATATPQEATDHVGTVGRPLSVTDVTVVDESGSPCPPGEVGELVVDGPTVTPGYYDDPEPTREAFGEFGLRTGDLAHLDDDGRLRVLNRREDRIVTGGENVDPREVATAIREHPAVGDAAVVGLDDPEWGERVAALVVADCSERSIREFCAGRLAGFKHPKTLGFADEIPRTASGTVDRSAVRERLRGERPAGPTRD